MTLCLLVHVELELIEMCTIPTSLPQTDQFTVYAVYQLKWLGFVCCFASVINVFCLVFFLVVDRCGGLGFFHVWFFFP